MRSRRWRDSGLALVMLAPSILILGWFVVYPLIKAMFLGAERCSPTGSCPVHGGLQQYVDAFRSNEFQDALIVTLKYALITVPIGLVLGLGLAVLADKYIKGVGIFRTIFSSTVATSVAVASVMWFFLFNPNIGVLADIFGGVFKTPGLLQDPSTALFAVSASSIWANLGFTFIVITAGLQSVPKDLYESAYVDGANGWGRFTNVTLPMISPVLLFVTVVLTARAFESFGEIDLLTAGGPQNKTTTLTYLAYGKGLPTASDDGLRATVSVLVFFVLLILALVQFRGLEKRVHYGN
ncbi:MAG: Glycerol-3-phosphate transporter permease [Ilumatobacteraceae bacterium]|nr:Glycerol-3-phosphate transporter permease [Ilumatobacteraceae bacterium]